MRKLVGIGVAGFFLGIGLVASLAAAEAVPRYTLMRPDPATLEAWVKAQEAMPRAPMARVGADPMPAASLSLLAHLNYVPAQRDQGACGNCWCWAGHGCMEILLHTQNAVSDRLSVQYVNSCESAAIGKSCCAGGWLSDLAKFYSATGYRRAVPWSNPHAGWQDGDASCDTPCGSVTTTPNYPVKSISAVSISTFGVGQAQAVANIKAILNQNQPVAFVFYLANQSDWDAFFSTWYNQPEGATVDLDYGCGHAAASSTDFGGHEVLCVGYNDTNSATAYWIMVNSWGATSGRPNDVFHVKMNGNYDCTWSFGGATYHSYFWEYLNVTYDLVPPTFSSIVASPSLARQWAAVTLTFTASETLSANPAVTVNGHAASYLSKSGNNYTYRYSIQPSDPDGAATLAISGTDVAGNPGGATNTTVLAVDKVAPILTCPTNLVLSADAGQCGRSNVTFEVAATDNGAVVSVNQVAGLPSGSTFPVGVTTNIFTAADAAGNLAYRSFTVTIQNSSPPVLVCAANKTVERGSDWSFDPPAALDACGGTNVTVMLAGLVTNGAGPEVIAATWTAVDACGNSNSCSQLVTVSAPPLVVSPAGLYFGLIVTGATAQASFIVSHTAGVEVQGQADVAEPFAIVSGTPFVLSESNSSANLVIRFAPIIPGVFSNLVVISSGGGASTNSVAGRAVGALSLLSAVSVGGDYCFSFDTVPGLAYCVEYKDDLNDPDWRALQSITGDGTRMTITNASALSARRFYRLRAQ